MERGGHWLCDSKSRRFFGRGASLLLQAQQHAFFHSTAQHVWFLKKTGQKS